MEHLIEYSTFSFSEQNLIFDSLNYQKKCDAIGLLLGVWILFCASTSQSI